SIGLACFILFLLYSVNEFTYDRFHADGQNIFRVYRWSQGNKDEAASGSPYMPIPLGPAMKAELPGVQQYVRIAEGWSDDFTKVNGAVVPISITYADASIFKTFSFKSREGNLFSSLDDPH